MAVLVDDVGSFPLPAYADRRTFESAYNLARKAIAEGKDITKDDFLMSNFHRIVVDSFLKKSETGLDVTTYPQHYDMHKQFGDLIKASMSAGTFLVDDKDAVIPEIRVLASEAKRLSEKHGQRILLRVCVTGPMELYLSEVGTRPFEDALMMFAESVRRFAKNSIVDSKHVKTDVISLDEPSLGFQDVNMSKDTFLRVMDKAFDFGTVTKQIHLHSPARIEDLLNIKKLDVLSFELAASPRNIDGIPKENLERHDKRVRVGISRTDIDTMIAELSGKGIAKPDASNLVEDEAIIKKRLKIAASKFGGTMAFAGPDCGLGGWPDQESAQLVLQRTVNAVKASRI